MGQMSVQFFDPSGTPYGIQRLTTDSGNLTDNIPVFSLADPQGNYIESHLDADGEHYLGTAVIQAIHESAINVTSTNLASGATFTGASGDSTLGANGIQLFHTADQDCILYIDQSGSATDFTNSLTDSFDCLANAPCSRTFVSVAPYYRLRVKNIGNATTTTLFTATALTPIINPLPRSLSEDNRLQSESTLTSRDHSERHSRITPTGELGVSPTYRIIGHSFSGLVKDTNFWTEAVAAAGTVTQSGGEIKLATGVTANGSASYYTNTSARFVAGTPNRFAGSFAFSSTSADNLRRAGAYDANNGFFFQLVGTTFSIGSRKGGVDSLVSSGSFNGRYGVNFTPITATETYYNIQIEYNADGAFFYVNDKLLHELISPHLTLALTLPVYIENVNSGGSITNIDFDSVGAVIQREGQIQTEPIYKQITGASTNILKYGAGKLHSIVNTNNSGSCTIYDNTSAAAPIIATIDLAKVVGAIPFGNLGVPFYTGLTIVTVGVAATITVVYE